jgi:hypothetical protein
LQVVGERFHNLLAPARLLLPLGNQLPKIPLELKLLAVDGL